MRQYKKKLIAISLASVMTVLGAFGEANYRNIVKALDFSTNQNNNIVLTVYTEKDYDLPLSVYKSSSNVYEIVLRETASEIDPSTIKYGSKIKSVNVATTPYTEDIKGKTKISVETTDNEFLEVKTATFISDTQKDVKMLPDNNSKTDSKENVAVPPKKVVPQKKKSYWDDEEPKIKKPVSGQNTQSPINNGTEDTTQDYTQSNTQSNTSESYNTNNSYANQNTTNNPLTDRYKTSNEAPNINDKKTNVSDSEPMARLMAMTGFLLIVLLIIIVYFVSKERMAAVIGEQAKYDFDTDDKKTEIKNIRKPQNTMKAPMPMPEPTVDYTETYSSNDSYDSDDDEQKNILDLDALYSEAVNSGNDTEVHEAPVQEDVDENNDDLDDFLSSFSIDEEQESEENNNQEAADEDHYDILSEFDVIPEDEHPEPQTVQVDEIPEEQPFDEELFEQCINDNNIVFSDADAEKIDSLMSIELTEDMIQTYHEYMRLLEEKKNAPTKEQQLENFISTYFVKQKITFTEEDVSALQKLMSVELDEDFVKNLHTNPIRTKEMMEELSKKDAQPHKTSEIKILGVKDLLPDLSKELKKYGNKRIRSEAKPQVVYFSEGYEYTKLSVDKEMLNLSSEANRKDPNAFRPSDFPPISESGYEVQTLNVGMELPDLEDVKANPEKYEDAKAPKAVADEQALLNSITNVTFKPFYDEENQILDLDKMIASETQENFEEFELLPEEPPTAELQNKNYVPRQKNEKTLNAQEIIAAYAPVQEQPQEVSNKTETIVKDINANETQKKYTKPADTMPKPKADAIPSYPQSCIYDGVSYKVVKVAICENDIGCYLTKNQNGYTVFGFIKDKLYKLNDYDELKSENMQVRINGNKTDGSAQYMVKVSTHKFLMQLVSDSMSLVMNLC